jgi:hypothetical protein
LVKATSTDLDARFEGILQMRRGVLHATEYERLTVKRDVPGVERHQTERLAATVSQPSLFLLLSRFFVFPANPLDRVGMQPEFIRNACGGRRQGAAGQPFVSPGPASLKRMLLCVVAVVPDEIHRTSLPVEFACMLISKAEFYGELLHELLAYPLPKGRGVCSQAFLIRARCRFSQDAAELPKNLARRNAVSAVIPISLRCA